MSQADGDPDLTSSLPADGGTDSQPSAVPAVLAGQTPQDSTWAEATISDTLPLPAPADPMDRILAGIAAVVSELPDDTVVEEPIIAVVGPELQDAVEALPAAAGVQFPAVVADVSVALGSEIPAIAADVPVIASSELLGLVETTVPPRPRSPSPPAPHSPMQPQTVATARVTTIIGIEVHAVVTDVPVDAHGCEMSGTVADVPVIASSELEDTMPPRPRSPSPPSPPPPQTDAMDRATTSTPPKDSPKRPLGQFAAWLSSPAVMRPAKSPRISYLQNPSAHSWSPMAASSKEASSDDSQSSSSSSSSSDSSQSASNSPMADVVQAESVPEASRPVRFDTYPTRVVLKPPPVSGTEWWFDTVWPSLCPLLANLPEEPSKLFLTEHLCAGTGPDLVAYRIAGIKAHKCIAVCDKKKNAQTFMKLCHGAEVGRLFTDNEALIAGFGTCVLGNKPQRQAAPALTPCLVSAGFPCQPWSKGRTKNGNSSKTSRPSAHPDYGIAMEQFPRYLHVRQPAMFWCEEVPAMEAYENPDADDTIDAIQSDLWLWCCNCCREGLRFQRPCANSLFCFRTPSDP